MSQTAPDDRPPSSVRHLLLDLIACLRFYSRIPLPDLDIERRSGALHAMPDFRRIVRMLPFAALIIALPAALILMLAHGLGLPPLLSSILALAALVATTGAFHEDGLADCADGLGGGMTVERKLEIMKDSRIGTFGGAALFLSLAARIAALSAIVASAGPEAGALALLAVAAIARLCGLGPLALLPPARTEGAAYAAQRPAPGPLAIGAICGLAIAILTLGEAGFGLATVLLACALALAAALAMAAIAQRQIGGQTGDIAGAAEQLAEIAFLCVLAAS